MKTTILVGAGATLAEALPSNPPRDRIPPLDATFFELCRIAGLRGRTVVQRFMQSNYGIDPFSRQYRMEEIFNYVYSDAFSASPSLGCFDAYWSLLRMYTSAIGRTTDSLRGTGRRGVGALLRALWQSNSGGELHFVTFNQDLVIEKAIESTAAMSSYGDIPWNITNTYDIDFSAWIMLTSSSNPFVEADDETVKIYKLHGSLNWIYKVRSGTDPRNSIRRPPNDLFALNERNIVSGLRYKPGKKWVDMVPLIIPPIYEKTSRYQDVVGGIWTKAAEKISSAERLVIFGYSFPDTDFAAKTLFRRCFYRNRDLQEIVVIDTDPNVASKVAEILEPKKLSFFRNVQDFKSL